MYKYANVKNNVVVGSQESPRPINVAHLISVASYPPIGSTYSNAVFTDPVVPTAPTALTLSNINISNASLTGNIYWVQENTAMTITGDVNLPNGNYMVMAERVVDASIVVDDARFLAVVNSGQMTINATFKSTGNYLISAARLNRGLDRINAPFNLAFADIEFDVYV